MEEKLWAICCSIWCRRIICGPWIMLTDWLTSSGLSIWLDGSSSPSLSSTAVGDPFTSWMSTHGTSARQTTSGSTLNCMPLAVWRGQRLLLAAGHTPGIYSTCVLLSIYLVVFLSIYLSVHLFVFLSICPSLC